MVSAAPPTERQLARSLLALSDLEKIICFQRRTIKGHRVAVGRDVKVLCSVDSGESSEEEDSKKTGARIADVHTYIQGSAKRWALAPRLRDSHLLAPSGEEVHAT